MDAEDKRKRYNIMMSDEDAATLAVIDPNRSKAVGVVVDYYRSKKRLKIDP